MNTEKRTIKINPDLFKVSEKNTSRKKKEKSDVKIKVKTEKPAKNRSLRRSVLKMIRDKQQEEYKKLFSNEKENPKKSQTITGQDEFNKDFQNSIEYFNSLVEKEKESKTQHNNTIKNYNEQPNIFNTYENVSNELPDVFNNVVPIVPSSPINIQKPILPLPKYGCLKNGSLPTYRTFYNKTRRSYPIEGGNTQDNTMTPQIEPPNQKLNNSTNLGQEEIKKDLSEKRQKFQKGELMKAGKKRMKYLKRRKIYKRTYKVGRSKTKPQISVLVSNKTVRNRITTEAQLLKQTPIHEVKQFLVKKGFIKVGTTTPNDVLRKMYESVSMICGDIQNHNPENLLYNFINSDK